MAFTPIIGSLATLEGVLAHTGYGCVYSSVSDVVVVAYGRWADLPGSQGVVKLCSNNGIDVTPSAEFVFSATDARNVTACYSLDNDVVVILYADYQTGGYPLTAVVCDVADNGESASFGSPATVLSSFVGKPLVISHEQTGDVIAFYVSGGGCYAKIGNVSGTSISFGSATTIQASGATIVDAAYDETDGTTIVVYNNGYSLYAVTCNIISGSISLGTPLLITSTFQDCQTVSFDPLSGRGVVVYRESSGLTFRAAGFIISGSVITVDLDVVCDITISSGGRIDSTYDGNCKKIMVVWDSPSGGVNGLSVSSQSLAMTSPAVLLTQASGAFPTLTYVDSAEKIAICNEWQGYADCQLFLAQLDESAPKNFWTNFSGQSEIIV